MSRKLDYYVNEIKNTLNTLLEASDPASMASMMGSPSQDDGLGGDAVMPDMGDSGPLPQGADMGGGLPGGDTLEPMGVQSSGSEEEVLSKSDQELLDQVPSAVSDSEDDNGKEEGSVEEVGKGEAGKVVEKPESIVYESRKKKKHGSKTVVTSSVKHVPKGTISKNQVQQEWYDLIDKILKSVTVVNGDLNDKVKNAEREVEVLKEHVRRLESLLYQSLEGMKKIVRESALHVTKSDVSFIIKTSNNLDDDKKSKLLKKIEESTSIKEVKDVLVESQHYQTIGSSATLKRSVSPMRMSNAEVDKIQEYKRSLAERQDGVLLDESKKEVGGWLNVPFSVSRLQEMAGIKGGDEFE
ncbi:MAG: hypothetical protein N3A54_00945 [Patescibacteria group bacterium]|nr:hypothetical protein [Patescibacteria group bacterium]